MKHKYRITYDSGNGTESRVEELTEDGYNRYCRIMNKQKGKAYSHQTIIIDIDKLKD